ncbi:MAG: SPOR domain-containing protein [Bacteroides sp.]|nr:SPOR domain-containing protein [Bacteroides sp.]
MRKLLFWGMVAFVVAFTSCKSSESAYKKAYEKAKQQELIEPDVRVNEGFEVTAPEEVIPVYTNPVAVEQTPVVNEPETSEKVTVVTGTDNLKKYGVVCGSFGLKANADGLKDFLESEGYSPVIALNEQKQMYRVVVVSFSDKESAVAARNAFKARYPNRNDFQGAWILNRLQ